ncbi:MAG: RNA ligase family protein, partial [Elusimicrobiota bacterium]
DGTSSTFVMCDDELHVCSRNFSLKETQRNTYWKMFYKYDIKNIIKDWKNKTKKQGLAIQGEVAGPGIQKNPLKLTDIQLFVGSSVEDKEKALRFAKRDLPEKPSVFVSVLNQGWIRPEIANMLLLMSRSGLKIRYEYPNAKPEQTNRNDIIKRFLETDYEYLLMLDADIVPQKNPLEMIKCGKDVINVAAPQWHEDDLYWVAMDKVDGGWKPLPVRRRRSLQEVDATGNACMIIRRDVLENIDPPWFDFDYDEYGKHLNGMEFRFCEKVKEAGYSIWVHFDYMASHFKELDLVKVLKRITHGK